MRLLARFLKLVLIALAVMALAGLCVLCVALVSSKPDAAPFLFVFVLLGSIALVGWWAVATATRRRSRSAAVLGYVEQAVRLNLPLPRMIDAMAQSEAGGQFKHDLQAAREALENGGPLAVVLSAVPDIPKRIIALIATAEHTGRLPQVLARVTEQRREALLRGSTGVPLYRTYPLMVAVVFVVIASMFVVFVAPKFEQIFKDFGAPMPWVTQITLDVCRLVGPWVSLALVIGLLALAYTAVVTRSRGAGFGLVERPLDWLANRLPWIGTMRMHRALGDVLEFTADAVESGRPIDRSLMEASQFPANSRLREMIIDWATRLSHGEPIDIACRAAGLPPLVCGMVATGAQTSDIGPVLQFLSRYYSTRFSRANELLHAAVVPMLAIGMGVMVGWLALSVVLPLVRLIDRVAPYPPIGL